MSIHIKRFSVIATFALAAFLVLGAPVRVHAHEDEATATQAAQTDEEMQMDETQSTAVQADNQVVNDYHYTAKKGDNLTLLVRRSVQLYSTAKQSPLSNAAIIYCETNIVRNLGSSQLDISDDVAVPFDQLQQFLESSKNLTTAQLAAWQRYAAKANFSLENIIPTNTDAATDAVISPNTTNETNNDDANPSVTPTQTDSGDKSSSLAWYWWVLGIIGIGIVYYLAGRTNNPKK